jgi:hypothetical protein
MRNGVGRGHRELLSRASRDRSPLVFGDELGGHRSADRPADHAPGEEIDDSRHIEPAFRCQDVGVKSAIHLRWPNSSEIGTIAGAFTALVALPGSRISKGRAFVKKSWSAVRPKST